MSADDDDITIDLRTIDDLFAEPAADPFDPESRFRSGVDEIADQARLLPLRWHGRIVLRMPPEAITPDLVARADQALDRYCRAKVEENTVSERDTRHQGRRGLVTAVPLLAALAAFVLGLLWLVSALDWPEVVTTVIVFWGGLAGWVVVWGPVDTLVYYWRPYRKEAQIYRNIARAELAVEPHRSG